MHTVSYTLLEWLAQRVEHGAGVGFGGEGVLIDVGAAKNDTYNASDGIRFNNWLRTLHPVHGDGFHSGLRD